MMYFLLLKFCAVSLIFFHLSIHARPLEDESNKEYGLESNELEGLLISISSNDPILNNILDKILYNKNCVNASQLLNYWEINFYT